ncbi:MAG: hypothetical protein JW795_00340, partial [Chitinivibrionales bacterium]|nr:hypothetical protein [Chitinivibrionales bacterium]
MKIFWLRLQIISFLFIMLQILEAASVQSAPEEASRRIFGLIINSDFDGAIRSADSCIHYDSLQPLYQVLKLSALGLQDMDYDRIIDTTRFLQSYETTLSAITAREKSAGVTSATLAFRGFAYAIHASFYLLHKQYFSALNTGFASLDWMEKAKKMDETNFDPDLIIGAYKCAKGELKKRLWMVLFWYPGSRKQGIEHLERCSRQGTIGAAVAQLALIDLY